MSDSTSRNPAELVARHTRLSPVRTLPSISLHTAHEGSGLSRLFESEVEGEPARPPYWAFPWAGGMAIAHHLFDNPKLVQGLRVFDAGAGSGIVAIAAAMAGAAHVVAAEADAYGAAAIALNAAANRCSIEVTTGYVVAATPPPVDIVLAGDVFYDAEVAARMTGFFERCHDASIPVLIGDPGRKFLPRRRLKEIARHDVPDFGDPKSAALKAGYVFEFRPQNG